MTLTLRTPADVVGNIAPMLGFVPTDSVVLYLLRADATGTAIVTLVRVDVCCPVEDADAAITELNLHRMGVNAALIVAIGANRDPDTASLIGHLGDTLTQAGATVLRRLHTVQVEHPGRWTDLDTGDTGPTYGYRDSVAAADAVHQGRVITACRDDIEREFTPSAAAPPVRVDDHDDLVTTTLVELTQALAGRRHLTPALAAHAGLLIAGNKHLRDQILARSCAQPQRGADLWSAIARHLRGAERVEALTLAAVAHYAANDAVRAGIALDAAERTARENRQPIGTLAQLLQVAIQTGVSPQQIRDMIARAAG